MHKKYDLAISFAGEQRELARSITRQLTPLGYNVFYDAYNTSETWGRDISVLFHEIYSQTDCILIIVSKEYIDKPWTRFERKSAMQNFINRPDAKILQLILDRIELPGLPTVIGTLDYDGDVNGICAKISTILGFKTKIVIKDGYADIQKVMEICFRRAIFTSMDDEISTQKMFRSIEDCIGLLNKFLPQIRIPEISQYVKKITSDLDEIDRYSSNGRDYTCLFSEIDRKTIDSIKLKIIDVLHYLNYQFATKIDIPDDIGLGYRLSMLYKFNDEQIFNSYH